MKYKMKINHLDKGAIKPILYILDNQLHIKYRYIEFSIQVAVANLDIQKTPHNVKIYSDFVILYDTQYIENGVSLYDCYFGDTSPSKVNLFPITDINYIEDKQKIKFTTSYGTGILIKTKKTDKVDVFSNYAKVNNRIIDYNKLNNIVKSLILHHKQSKIIE